MGPILAPTLGAGSGSRPRVFSAFLATEALYPGPRGDGDGGRLSGAPRPQVAAANRTATLVPSHNAVPWATQGACRAQPRAAPSLAPRPASCAPGLVRAESFWHRQSVGFAANMRLLDDIV